MITLETIDGDLIFPAYISYKGAKELTWPDAYCKCKVTVEQHYFCRHNYTLKYPQLPCIVENGKNNVKYFYPIETLKEYDSSTDPDFM
jgi:hypothetical protein